MNTIHILLIEDFLEDEKLLIRQFHKAGYQVVYTCVQTQKDFLHLLSTGSWDVIISDYNLPAFTGIEALRLVKTHHYDIPFIIVSGAIGEETAVEAMREGADDYLMKHNLHRLIPAVERAIRENVNRKQKKIAEEERDEMHLRLEGIISSAMDAIITIDENQYIVMVNRAAIQMFSYSHTELVGKKLSLLLPYRFRQQHTHYVHEFGHSLKTTRQMGHNIILYGLKSDDSEFPIEASISQVDVKGQKLFTVIIRDITEKIKATRELEAEKQRLELALSGGDLGLWDWDITTNRIIYNARWAERLGYALSEIGVDYESWTELIHAEDKPIVMQILTAHLQGNISYYLAEYRIKSKDGSWKWMMDRGKVLARDKTNKPLRMVGTSLDITYKRKAEEKIRFEAQLLELLDEAVISLSEEFIIRSWSAGAEKIFKIASSSVLGLHLSKVLTIEHYENQLGHTLGPLADTKEAWKGEVIVHILQGETCQLFITFTPMLQQEEGGYILICKDINEISAIQHRLIEQQSYIISAIENSADAIFALNENYEFLYYNTVCRESFGHVINIPIAIGNNVMIHISEQDQLQIKSNWERVQKGEKFSYNASFCLPNGDIRYYEIFVNPVYGTKGEVNGASYRYTDITERRFLDQQMQEMQEEMMQTKLQEQKIHATALLEGQELERKRLGRELHDGLGQMMNVLKMQLSQESASPTAKNIVDNIITDIIRVNNDLMPIVLQDFGLNAAIKELIEGYRKLTEADLYYYTDIGARRFDSKFEINVFRVIQESLSNAVKYSKSRVISVQMTSQINYLLIMVEDDGIGFEPEYSKKKIGKGGYGILNMKFRIESLNGKMLLETSINRGCVINIELPLS